MSSHHSTTQNVPDMPIILISNPSFNPLFRVRIAWNRQLLGSTPTSIAWPRDIETTQESPMMWSTDTWKTKISTPFITTNGPHPANCSRRRKAHQPKGASRDKTTSFDQFRKQSACIRVTETHHAPIQDVPKTRSVFRKVLAIFELIYQIVVLEPDWRNSVHEFPQHHNTTT
jgi:hypothetical protein